MKIWIHWSELNSWTHFYIYLNKNRKIYWSKQSFTGLGLEDRCLLWGLKVYSLPCSFTYMSFLTRCPRGHNRIVSWIYDYLCNQCLSALMLLTLLNLHISGYNTFSLRSWSYCSWIYNYLCYQCISPITLLVRITLMARCTDTK